MFALRLAAYVGTTGTKHQSEYEFRNSPVIV